MPDLSPARDVDGMRADGETGGPLGNRWAVIVGISAYRDNQLNLKFAHQDARSLYDFLLTPEGGAFTAQRMRLLVNGDATTSEVKRAIRVFLAATGPDDLVLLYFACHGAPDLTGVAKPLYLLTHDADLRDIAGTALPMDDIAWCMNNYVRASRVVIIADACYSAGLVTGGRDPAPPTAMIVNQYLQKLSESPRGIGYLTSARKDQQSLEDVKWGGGHGVFTWFLLEGLQGAADGYGSGRVKDGLVTLDELAEYVTDRVRHETDRHQEPLLGGGDFPRTFPMAVTKELDFRRHDDMARAFLEVGWLLDDPAPFLVAAHEAREAAALAAATGVPDGDSTALAGEALLAAGEYPAALDAIDAVFKPKPDQHLHRGLALTAMGDPGAAARELTTFADTAPQLPDAGWARDYAVSLRAGGTIRVLLIAVGIRDHGPVLAAGSRNDATVMTQLAAQVWRVPARQLTVLVDESATRDAVLAAFDRLAEESGEDDVVVVCFAGLGAALADANSPYLLTYGSTPSALVGLTPAELHQLVTAIPACERLVVLDTAGNEYLTNALREDPSVTALLAAAPGKLAYIGEWQGQVNGILTRSLGTVWTGAELTYGELLAAVNQQLAEMSANFGRNDSQTALLLGDSARAVPRGTFPATGLWRADRVRRSLPPAPPTVAACQAGGWPNGRRLLARHLEATGDVTGALDLLRARAADRGDVRAWLDVAVLAADANRIPVATEALAAAASVADKGPWPRDYAPAQAAAETLASSRPRALLVGTGQGVQVDAMREFLVRQGFAAEEIVVAEGLPADVVASEHRRLLDHSVDQLGVLHLCDPSFQPTGDAPNLVTILDQPNPGQPPGAATLQLVTPGAQGGLLTDHLIRAAVGGLDGITYRRWAELASTSADVKIVATGPSADDGAFRHHTRLAAVRAEVTTLDTAGAAVAYQLAAKQAERAEEQRTRSPLANLAMGLACRALGRIPDAIRLLRAARNLYNDDPAGAGFTAGLREASYHLGQLLYERPAEPADLDEAVSVLRRAHELAPDDPRCGLHLGLALQAKFERRTGLEVAELLRRYLWAGAPLGRHTEVSRVLAGDARRSEVSGSATTGHSAF